MFLGVVAGSLLAPANVSTSPSPAAPRRLSLGVIFLTLYIDLIGFSIIFPLGPDLIRHYLELEGNGGLVGWVVTQLLGLARSLGIDSYPEVLFGGVLSSVFSILQFVFSPFWGSVSDRRGRRSVLELTVLGTALGYLLWVFSGSFWLFLVSRVVCGAFSGNISVATAAVADVTSRAERSKAMGIVGAAFGLGLVTGPTIGGLTAGFNLLQNHPSLARFGINPFSVPALISFALCRLNFVWIQRRFKETLAPETRGEAQEPRLRNPVSAILGLGSPEIRRANLVAFVFSVAFVAMESSLTFLATRRFGYTARANSMLLGYLGVCAVITQGYIVRKLLTRMEETKVLNLGLALTAAGLLLVGFAPQPWMLYVGLAVLAGGSGLVNPATTGLISLYAKAEEQGRVLGIFRSLGSLSRAITPVCAGVAFWALGSTVVFAAGAAMAIAALFLSTSLPKPVK